MTRNKQDNDTETAVKRSVNSVEDHWHKSLTRRDIDGDQAEQLIRLIQSHPKLGLGDPSKNEVEELIKRGIEEVDLEARGIDKPNIVREELIEALHDGLAGNCPGPMSLTIPYHAQHEQANTESLKENEPVPKDSTERNVDSGSADTERKNSVGDGDTDSTGIDEGIFEKPNQTGGGQPAQAMGFAGGERTEQTSQGDDGKSDINSGQLELEHLVSSQISGYMINERLDLPDEGETIEMSKEELIQIIELTAEEAAGTTLNSIEQYLYGHMNKNAREMIFEQTITEPTKRLLLQLLQQAQNK